MDFLSRSEETFRRLLAEERRRHAKANRKLMTKQRKEYGLTQKRFAKRLGVAYRTVQSWENGERIPFNAVFLQAIIDELDLTCSTAELLINFNNFYVKCGDMHVMSHTKHMLSPDYHTIISNTEDVLEMLKMLYPDKECTLTYDQYLGKVKGTHVQLLIYSVGNRLLYAMGKVTDESIIK